MLAKVQRLIDIEKKRYIKKGYLNVIIALTLLFSVMKIAHAIGTSFWPHQIQNTFMFVTIWSIVLNLGMQVVGYLLYLPGYMGWSDYFKQHLVNKKSLRPWQRKNWGQVKTKTLINFVINQLIIYPIIIYLTNAQGIKLRFEGFPTFKEFSLQILFIYYAEDFFFYCFHRLFHTYPSLYKIHKVHHQYDTLYTWVAEYMHPADFLFANLIPGAIPLIMMGSRLHCFTFFYWIFWKILLSCQNHSGYEFEWSPFRVFPMIANTSHHDNHHSQNVGNFGGSCYFWDLMLNTYVPYCKQF